MRILFAANTSDSRSAGIAKIMNSLRDEMEQKGHTVDIFFAEDVPTLRVSRRFQDLSFSFLVVFEMLRLWKKQGKHDIVAIHSLAGAFYVFLRKFLRFLPPCVLVSYGADEMRWELEKEEERLGYRKIRLFSHLFYPLFVIAPARFATRHADHVMVAATSEIDFFEKMYRMSRDRVSFIPNGVSPEYFVSRNYSRSPQKLLFLGGWEWRKGIRYLAEAFNELAKKYPQLTLSLVGIGVEAATAKQLFALEYHDRIVVIPKVHAEDTPEIYAEHDIFVFPSLFESMSLVVPEAMAAGMPVVTTRACGMKDIIEHDRTGLLAEPRNSKNLVSLLETLLNQPALCEKLGRAAQNKAKEITWDRVADDTLKMYKKILSPS